MIMVKTIQGDRIPIGRATEEDFQFRADSKMVMIKDYCFNWDQILYVHIIDEEEDKE